MLTHKWATNTHSLRGIRD